VVFDVDHDGWSRLTRKEYFNPSFSQYSLKNFNPNRTAWIEVVSLEIGRK
jgi:hypothetical protein